LLTGVELPETTLKNVISKSVTYKYPSKSDRKEVLLGILQEIVRKKIPMDKVTLLSPKKLEHSYLKDDFQIIGYIDKGLKSSTIQGYKGLENSIIILFDFEDVTSDQMQRLLYVGISRARQQLFLVFDQSQIEPVKNLMQENAPKILQG
jgi:superfamily I DNA/RNA helicase